MLLHRKYAPKIKSHPSPKLAQQVLRARRLRWALIQLLGAKCVECGVEYDSAEPSHLEFDHTQPRDWEPRKINRWQRMRKYWQDWERGIITLRCKSCNSRKGYPDGQEQLLEKVNSQPF